MSISKLPRITVVIPCYNCFAFVSRAIESVIAQTVNDWELILVNNNSIDNTIDLLNQYKEKYPNQIKVLNEPKKGAPAARNLGMSVANGEWIQFLDADDAIDEFKFERQLGIIKQLNPDVILGNYNRVVNKFGFTIHVEKKPNYKDFWKGLIEGRCGITSANLYRKHLLNKVNGWNEDLTSSQETELLFRLKKENSTIVFDENISAYIYFESNSISRNVSSDKNKSLIRNYVQLRVKIKDYLKDQNLLSESFNKAIDLSLYSYLIHKYNRLPEFVDAILFDLNLSLNKYDMFKAKSKSKFKKIIGQ